MLRCFGGEGTAGDGHVILAGHVIKTVEQQARYESKPWPESKFRVFRVH